MYTVFIRRKFIIIRFMYENILLPNCFVFLLLHHYYIISRKMLNVFRQNVWCISFNFKRVDEHFQRI